MTETTEIGMQAAVASVAPTPSESTGVLLLHGLTGTPTELAPVQRLLTRRGFRVATPLLAGHGGTNDDLLATRWGDWAASARAALRDLSAVCDRVYVGGLCMGAQLAIVLAAEDPKVKGLILISIDAGRPAKGSHTWGFLLPLGYLLPFRLQKLFYWTERAPFGLKDPDLRDEIAYRLTRARQGHIADYGTFRTYVPSLVELGRLRRRSLALAPGIRCPVLILQSSEDTLADPENANIVYRALGSSRKTLCCMSGCDHMMTIDLRRHEVANLIETFIRGLP